MVTMIDSTTTALRNAEAFIRNESNSKSISTGSVRTQNSAEAVSFITNSAVAEVATAATKADQAPDIRKGVVESNPEDYAKNVTYLLATLSALPADQASKLYDQSAQGLAELANKSGFDITTIANGFSGRAALVLQTITIAAQEHQQLLRDQASATNKMARSQAESSASQTIEAGNQSKKMAIVQGAVSMGVGLAAGGMQTKALNNSNTAIKTHGTNSISAKNSSDALSAHAAPAKRLASNDGVSDATKLSKVANHNSDKATNESLQQQLRMNDANKLQTQGMTLGQMGQSMAGMAAANGHADKANAEAMAQLRKTDENTYTSSSDSSERAQQAAAQLVASLLQMLSQLLSTNTNAASTMTGNIRG